MELAPGAHLPGAPVESPDEATPLQRSWIVPALLLAWLGTFVLASAYDDERLARWAEPGAALTYAAAAALVGLAVFMPVRPSALLIRAGVYAVPVLLVTILLLFTEPGVYTGIPLAFLPPWAVGTALYGLRGGLPKGARHVLLYAVAAPVSVGMGFIAGVVLFFLGFAGLPVQIFLGLPLLPLLLLLKTRCRRQRKRMAAEIILSAAAAVCGMGFLDVLGAGPAWSTGLGTAAALLVYLVAGLCTAMLLALGHLARFDTAEYPATA